MRTGTVFVYSFLSIGVFGGAAPETRLVLHPESPAIGRYEKIEFRIDVPGDYARPFDAAVIDLCVQFEKDGERVATIPAFLIQEYERRQVRTEGRMREWLYPTGLPVWKARFAPMQTGSYQAVAVLEDAAGSSRSAPVDFACHPSSSRGFVRVSAVDPRHFCFSNGDPFFPVGQNLAFIGSGQYVTLSRAEEIFAQLAANGANYLRIWTGCEDWALAIEARKSAWGRSWAWRPPIVTDPADPARRCVRISSTREALPVSPSHPVALRPGTRYVVSGRIRTAADAAVRLEVQGTQKERLLSDPALAWTSFRHEFETGSTDLWLQRMQFRLETGEEAWLSDLSLRELAGGPELLWEAEVNRPIRGFYNPVDSFLLDAVVNAAARNGLYLQLCFLTRDLYMNSLQDPQHPDYAQAIRDARNALRYAVARWGYSTHIAVWEYFNEMNPGLPTDAFYAAVGEYLETIDPYRHLRSTSAWGPSPKDWRHPHLDLADAHFYLRPADRGRLRDEVDAVGDRARLLREHAPRKPALLGEFGLADDQWRITAEMRNSRSLVDVEHALWASALSGLSGTALPWWWERIDERNGYSLYRPLSQFIADIPWASGSVEPVEARVTGAELEVMGLRAGNHAWLWVYDPRAAWRHTVTENQDPPEITNARLTVEDLADGKYRVQWWDTREGPTPAELEVQTIRGTLELSMPPFRRGMAARLWPGQRP